MFNTISFDENQNTENMLKLLSSFKEVALVYRSDSNASNVVYFAIKGNLSKQEVEGS